jgi:hypothetical protein
MATAEQQILDSLDQLLAESEDSLDVPASTLNQAVSDVVTEQAKSLKRLTEKILRSADREAVKADDALNAINTGLLGGIDAWMNENHYLLSQMAAKGGLQAIGAPLETALETATTAAPQLEYLGTLVLAVKEAIPYFEQLIEVLREIRDRMPNTPVRVPGEPSDDDQGEPELKAGTATYTDNIEADW